ncbi:NAD(P)-binding protein [Lepidopterella palustris CBS 459.81]|uniref:NAD(P)-binding protein n=1 Tax=Lepidopterella palustris CBS 459.81 TaxID=1314670 RepID=A0A8E2EA79_9PEZI|nr:NAD(P)-binding protein [Lepidopterella palustris CBS 459.81]
MVVVGIAGGTGGLGRAIVDVLKAQGKHTIKVLSRKATSELEQKLGVSIATVDYTDATSLARTLEQNDIHTVISTLATAEAEPQLNLIRAADMSAVTKRFAPSEFGILYTARHAKMFPIASNKLLAVEELKKTSLEYTLFSNGFFLDYFGMPSVKSYLQPLTIVVDLANNVAAIPGDGNTPVVFTHTFDVANFVAASLDLENWPERSIIIGDKVTWNKFVETAEAVKGTKFDVTYDSVETLKTGKVTELPSHVPVYPFFPKEQLQGLLSIFGLWFEDGTFNLDAEKSLNKIFPEIQTKKVEDILKEVYT